MNPRDKLIKELSVIIREAFQKGFDSESVSELDNFDGFAEAEEMLDTYAIGRWVSVGERLPKDQQTVITQWINGYISYYTFWTGRNWCVKSLDSEVTHWLDLDLPSGKGEA